MLIYTFRGFLSNSSQTADRRLLDLWAIYDLTPDGAEIEASRRFHLQYWLGLAEFAIARDHRQSCYGSLTANIRQLLDSIQDPLSADEQTVATLKHDLAFLEGNVRAFRDVVAALRKLKESCERVPAEGAPETDAPADQDCGSRAA